MSRISIIIPIYNVEKYLPRCLDSVLNQTFKDWQAILVDDGSTDKSGKIADKYARHDKRFVVVHKENGGLSDARNIGMHKAVGDYIMYLDSDDFIHPQTMEILYGLGKKSSADLVVFKLNMSGRESMQKMLELGADITEFIPDSYCKKYNLNTIDYLLTDNILAHASERKKLFNKFVAQKCYPVLKMLRRDLAQKCEFIRGIIIEDFPWWASVMSLNPRTVVADAPFYFYTPNANSILGSEKTLFMAQCICRGLQESFKIYKHHAKKKLFYREFLWPFAITTMRLIGRLQNVQDIEKMRKKIKSLYDMGVFESPQTMRAKKYKRRIEKFISQIS